MFSNFPTCVKLGIGYGSEYWTGIKMVSRIRIGIQTVPIHNTRYNKTKICAQKKYCINCICLKKYPTPASIHDKNIFFNIVALASYLVCGNGFKGSKTNICLYENYLLCPQINSVSLFKIRKCK
jgi:hypothetical protein